MTRKYLFFMSTLLAMASVHSQSVTSIPIRLSTEGHILVNAKINGVEGTFIFDTGAGVNMLTKKFATQANVLAHKEPGTFTSHRSTGEPVVLDFWTVQTFSIGSISQLKIPFCVLDVDFPFDGLISLLPFTDRPFTIDYKSSELIFESSASIRSIKKTGINVPLILSLERGKSVTAFVRVAHNTDTVEVSLDSGAGANVFRFNSTLLKKELDESKKGAKRSEIDSSWTSKIQVDSVREIQIVGTDITAQNIQASYVQGMITEGTMSINWIGQLLTFDIENRIMIVRSK